MNNKTQPLSLKDSLTTSIPLAYIKNALAKSSVGIGLSLLTGAQVASFAVKRLFLCVYTSYGWLFGAYSYAPCLLMVRPTRSVRHPIDWSLYVAETQPLTGGI